MSSLTYLWKIWALVPPLSVMKEEYWSVEVNFKTYLWEAQHCSYRNYWQGYCGTCFLKLLCCFWHFQFSPFLQNYCCSSESCCTDWQVSSGLALCQCQVQPVYKSEVGEKPLFPLLVAGVHCPPVSEYMGSHGGQMPSHSPVLFLPCSKINCGMSLISSRELTPSRGWVGIQPLCS